MLEISPCLKLGEHQNWHVQSFNQSEKATILGICRENCLDLLGDHKKGTHKIFAALKKS